MTATPAPDTLAALLRPHCVPWQVLHQRYGSLLELVRVLIGVVPECDPYLEIWPPAFRTYNLIVPSFLNLPLPVFGLGATPAPLLGLGMYVASRAAECPYCSAHTCSFALRRGATPEKMAQALVPDRDTFSEAEVATIAVARALARIPCELTADERRAFERAFTPEQAEWLLLGIVMMGFLNKFMDAIGVELEPQTAAEVAPAMGAGWSAGKAGRALEPGRTEPLPPIDSMRTRLRLLPLLPGALRLDRDWKRGVPARWPAVGAFLREHAGHDFPLLTHLRHDRPRRAIAALLRENLDPATTVLGLQRKVLAGAIFATVVDDETLAADMRMLAAHHGLSPDALAEAVRYAAERPDTVPGTDPTTRAALQVTLAASPSPAAIDASTVELARALEPAAVVELVTWLAVLQMLHRLASYHATPR